VDDERIEPRPFLCFEDFGDGIMIECIGRESVNRLRGQRHRHPAPQQGDGAGYGLRALFGRARREN
jgi:hypothetical protein